MEEEAAEAGRRFHGSEGGPAEAEAVEAEGMSDQKEAVAVMVCMEEALSVDCTDIRS